MMLPAFMTVQFIPPGTQISGFAVAARQAEGIANALGGLATTAGTVFWFLTLLNGFWILFSTQLGVVDTYTRVITDILWTGSRRIREWRGGDVRAVYYSVLAAFVIWGCIAINLAQPFVLIQIGAFIAAFNFVVITLHTLYVNRKFLPRELQPSVWRQLLMLAMVVFFAEFTVVGILNRIFGMRVETDLALIILAAIVVATAAISALMVWRERATAPAQPAPSA